MKKTARKLIKESDIRKMQVLAGLIDDDSDLAGSRLLTESTDDGSYEQVIKEEEDEDEDEGFGDEETDDVEDEGFGEDEGEDLDEEEDLDSMPEASPMGAGVGDKDSKIRQIFQLLSDVLGVEVEIDGADGTDVEEPAELGAEEHPEPDTDNMGGDDLSAENQRMLAEIFQKTSKQIMSSLQKKKVPAKKTVPTKRK